MTLKESVSFLRDEFFGGAGRTIYISGKDVLRDFAEEAPYEIYGFGVPDIKEMIFPIAIIYGERRAFWVDSSGALWSCGPQYCRFIKSKEWLSS